MRFAEKLRALRLAKNLSQRALAEVPTNIRRRAIERSDAFRATAACDDNTLDKLMGGISRRQVLAGGRVARPDKETSTPHHLPLSRW